VNIHEYQAKALLREYGVAVPAGALATTPAEAEQAARSLEKGVCVVKAQVHAGGRGKGGGIKLAKSPSEAKQVASEILGMTLRTHQTGPEGKLVRKVYVESGSEIAHEYYLAVVLDRAEEKLAIIASTEGGMEIEEVAAKTPEKILSVTLPNGTGLPGYVVRRIGYGLGLDAGQLEKLHVFLAGLHRLFVDKDASLVEINPLVATRGGDLLALDCKLGFDDNALYRHPEIAALRDPDEEDPRERAAKEIDLAYVGLDGDIGCVVNGAGLAMATLDMIKLAGGEPANFLDIGGGASPERVAKSFKAVLKDKKVKALLLNVFAGINRCDWVAKGVVDAVTELNIKMPVVVRLAGTNVEEGRRILNESGLTVITAETLAEAAEKAVAAAKSAA
jgi:succinyl-CoA synthetase beta subunit